MIKMKNYEEIIEGCKRQDRKYQEILFKNFYPMLMPVSTRMAPDNATAEDLLQDAFIKIFEKIDTIDKNNIEVVFSWCKKVLTNIIIDYYRSKPHRLLPSINDIDDLIDDDVIDDDINDTRCHYNTFTTI
jgi:RNA polymerase sigma-70 factor (ECF subfamily)